ncbi:hypothetical protein J7M23_07295 [Candidatus Sumerlaeota bacterium]|nr:hypothetical protein [Candidatus Sumerlaeota bacterium]
MKKLFKKIKGTAQKGAERVLKIWSVVFLTLTYFTVFAFTAIILKMLGKRHLIAFKRNQDSYWLPRPEMKHTIEEMKRQF